MIRKSRPFRFRIPIGTLHVRVKIFDGLEDMYAAVTALHPGIACKDPDGSITVTITPPTTAPQAGMFADVFFAWRSLSYDTVSHEAFHVAWHWEIVTKLGLGEDSEEKIARVLAKVTGAIHRNAERGRH